MSGEKCDTPHPVPSRLDRIEAKLDEMASVLVEMARHQQQLVYLEERMNYHSAALHEVSTHVEEIRRKVPVYDNMVDMKERFVLIILTAVLLGVLGLLGFKYFI